jgi:hypothetical protein
VEDTVKIGFSFWGFLGPGVLINPDVACTLALQFLIRDGRLHTVAFMRGNDVLLGLLCDVFSFTFIAEFAALQLGVPLGSYTHHVASMHVNEPDLPRVRAILAEPDPPDQPAPTMPAGTGWDTLDAIVFTGYYHKEENATHLRGLGVEVPYGEDWQRRKVLPADLDARVVQAWRESGTTVPLFRKTSCGVTAAWEIADYNGHLGVPELCDICPIEQLTRCKTALRPPTGAEFVAALESFGFDPGTPFRVEDGHVLTVGLGEQRRYALMHHFGFQVWEAEHPHMTGAHGRAFLGHRVSDEEQARYDGAMGRLAFQARHEDD